MSMYMKSIARDEKFMAEDDGDAAVESVLRKGIK